MYKAHLARGRRKSANDLAHKYANLIIREAQKESKSPMKELLDNLAGLAAFLLEFLSNPHVELPSRRRHISFSLMKEIKECAPNRGEQALFISEAIKVYTKALSFLESDIPPFAPR